MRWEVGAPPVHAGLHLAWTSPTSKERLGGHAALVGLVSKVFEQPTR